MSAADVEAFSAVLASDHPEEYLSGSPRGVVGERDAVLNLALKFSGDSINKVDHAGGSVLCNLTLRSRSCELSATMARASG